MAAHLYYLGPWTWRDHCWRAPEGTRGLLDLRPLSAQSLPGVLGERPLGLFAVDPAFSLDSEYDLLGNGDFRELKADAALADAWESLLGYRPQGETLADLVWDHLTGGGDPTGADAGLPLMPASSGRLELHLGGHSLVKSSGFSLLDDTPHADRVRTLLQRQYRRLYEDEQAQRLRPDHPRRVLDFWCEKYRLNKRDAAQWRRLIPREMRGDHPGPLRHETTITDNFNRLNSADLGTSSEGWSWTETSGNHWRLDNNHAGTTTSSVASDARAETDLSSDDHYAQCDINNLRTAGASTNAQAGACARFAAAARTYYFARIVRLTSDNIRLTKMVAGAETDIGSDSAVTVDAGDPIKTEADGSTIKSYFEGVEKHSVTDTAITGNTRTGIYGYANGTGASATELENFVAADLVAGGLTGRLLSGSLLRGGLLRGGSLKR